MKIDWKNVLVSVGLFALTYAGLKALAPYTPDAIRRWLPS